MNFIKQYLNQCLVTAANNLRLSTEKIEVVSLLKDYLNDCEDLEETITRMKKITELSKLAIKLGQIYQSITKGSIDFLKLSDNFKEHSHSLVKEFSNLLDIVTPLEFSDVIKRIEPTIEEPEQIPSENPEKENIVSVELNKLAGQSESEGLKEEIILDDLHDEDRFDFENFEKTILKPIKELDAFFKKLPKEEFNKHELEKFIDTMRIHAELSSKVGFEILSNMHLIVGKALELIRDDRTEHYNELVEGMRACLIVIVAIVRSKEVDITNYLSRAEKFGKEILSIK